MNFAGRALVDWNVALRMGNSLYDRLAEAMRKPTRAQRRNALADIDRDIAEMSKKAHDPSALAWSFLAGPRRAASQFAGQLLVSLLLPAVSSASEAEDRWTMQWQVHELAFALAAYHADHGAYPAKLADLKPKYVPKIPTDMFNHDADLHYTRKGDGYRLYSVGPNGIDNGGRGYADREKSNDPSASDWDDIVVRIGGVGCVKRRHGLLVWRMVRFTHPAFPNGHAPSTMAAMRESTDQSDFAARASPTPGANWPIACWRAIGFRLRKGWPSCARRTRSCSISWRPPIGCAIAGSAIGWT